MKRFFALLCLSGILILPVWAQHVPVVMNLSAHPDDEDGATLAYYRYKFGVKTYSVCFTRGEGGQNEIGPELYADLGVLRTAETEKAAKIIGSEVYFLNFVDFGFSKTASETFQFWGKDETIARLVYIIRKLKPDVLFTNHDSTSGHGNHQAVGIAALQAFSLAADPSYHPEQLREPGVSLFQPKKLFMRIFFQRDTLLKPDVVNPTATDTLPLGKTATQLAVEALAQHRTQGMDKVVASGRFGRFLDSTRYILVRESAPFKNDRGDFLGGLHTPGEARLSLFPSRSLLSVSASDSVVVRGEKFTVDVEPRGRLTDLHVTLDLPEGWTSNRVEAAGRERFEVRVGREAGYTFPKVRHLYETMRTIPAVTLHAAYVTGGKQTSETLPLFIDVAPDDALFLSSPIYRVSEEPTKIAFRVVNYFPNKSAGRVTVLAPEGWQTINSDFAIAKEDSAETDTVTLVPPAGLREGTYSAKVCIESDTAVVALKKFDVAVAGGVNVGIIQSYDDVFRRVLDGLKVRHSLLEENDLVTGDLSLFSAIIIDIRAYLVRPDLVRNNGRLLDYVRNGGTLVVMYQRLEEWKPEYAPYPIAISRDRITDETAPVTVLSPGNILFNQPNRLDSTTWDGWVQERSLYMPSKVAPQYEKLISCSDPGEKPLDTGLLMASYGKGKYIYSAFVWYRELKEVNKGAFRMFANMISVGK